MNPVWTLARKDLRLLLRDPKAAVVLLLMPFVFILVLGLSLGEGFGQKPDDRLRVSVVNLDQGYRQAKVRAAVGSLAATPALPGVAGPVAAAALAGANRVPDYPPEPWSDRVLQDLAQSAEIRVEVIPSLEQAERLVRRGERAAVLVFGPRFSERVAECSFLTGGINPFYRDGVDIRLLDAQLLTDPTQITAASIIQQVGQGTMLRVTLPWMIGRAFEQIGEPAFVDLLGAQPDLDVELPYRHFIDKMATDPAFQGVKIPLVGSVQRVFQLLPEAQKADLAAAMKEAFPLQQVLRTLEPGPKRELAAGLQDTLQHLFAKYDLTAKTWTALTKSRPHESAPGAPTAYADAGGSGLLNRGAQRYQLLVPSYTVMFAFFLVLTVGWLFVAERRQGTIKRLLVAPLTRTQIVLGKLLPCLLVSLFQGVFLLLAGKFVFGMDWGPYPSMLLPVVFTTSLAAMGLALLVAALARTETQVAIYGTLLVLLLAGLSGCLMGDRSMMPEAMQEVSRITPHAWALDAYRQLLTVQPPASPDLVMVAQACLALTGFGLLFTSLAWVSLRLEA